MERRNFIKSAGAAGVAAIGLSTAGCLGDNAESSPQPGDEPIQNPGWFSISTNTLGAKMPDTLKITQSSVFRTTNGFGVMGVVKNTGNQPYVRVQVHAQLVTGGSEVIGNGVAGFTESDAIDDLGAGEIWRFSIQFEDTDPQAIFSALNASGGNGSGGGNASGGSGSNVTAQVWATGNIRGADQATGNAQGNGSNAPNAAVGSGNFLFGGSFLNINSNGQVISNGQTVGTVSIISDNTSGSGFQNVRITQSGQVINQQGQVVGQVQVQQMSSGGNTTGSS